MFVWVVGNVYLVNRFLVSDRCSMGHALTWLLKRTLLVLDRCFCGVVGLRRIPLSLVVELFFEGKVFFVGSFE